VSSASSCTKECAFWRNTSEELGRAWERANEAYNSAVGSLEARVLPAARRFKDLGVVSGDEIPVLSPVETTPRTLGPPEANGSGEKDE